MSRLALLQRFTAFWMVFVVCTEFLQQWHCMSGYLVNCRKVPSQCLTRMLQVPYHRLSACSTRHLRLRYGPLQTWGAPVSLWKKWPVSQWEKKTVISHHKKIGGDLENAFETSIANCFAQYTFCYERPLWWGILPSNLQHTLPYMYRNRSRLLFIKHFVNSSFPNIQNEPVTWSLSTLPFKVQASTIHLLM